MFNESRHVLTRLKYKKLDKKLNDHRDVDEENINIQIQTIAPRVVSSSQNLRVVTLSEIDRDEALEALELVRSLEDFRECSLAFGQVLEMQQGDIDQIETQLDQTETRVVEANNQLVEANGYKRQASSLKGTVTGLISGLGAGGALGLCTGLGAIPCIVVGGIGGTVLGFGSSQYVTNYLDMALDKIRHRKERGSNINKKDLDEPSLERFTYTTEPASQFEKHLLQALKTLQESGDITHHNYRRLLEQGESFKRSVQMVETIQQELVASGELVARLKTSSILYFLKLSFTPTTQRQCIDQIVDKINKQVERDQEPKQQTVLEKITSNVSVLTDTFFSRKESSERFQRHSLLPFLSWTDIAIDNHFFLLQRFQSKYRAVAINPDDCNDVVELYKFQTDSEQDAVKKFDKVKAIFLKIFNQVEAKNVYIILSRLPSIDKLLESEQDETLGDRILDEMNFILCLDIKHRLTGIENELNIQNTTLSILGDETVKTDLRLKRLNSTL